MKKNILSLKGFRQFTKPFALLLALIGLSLFTSAQNIPQKIAYQGMLIQNEEPYTGNANFNFSLEGTGWSENQNDINVTDGIYFVLLGSVNSLPVNLFETTSGLFLQISVNGSNLEPKTEIVSVAYAFVAQKAHELIGSIDGDQITENTIDITKLNFIPLVQENDPQVGSNTLNYASKWDGNALVSSQVYDNGAHVGIGTSSPNSLLSVGSNNQFQVNSSGNIAKINNVSSSWPSSQGAANSTLQNDGSGNLSWKSSTPSGVKQVIRGTITVLPFTTKIYSQSFSPTVVSSKCVVNLRYISELGETHPEIVIVTALSNTSITIQISHIITNHLVEYEIIEYY